MWDPSLEFPHSIREINDLPTWQKNAIYHTLIPQWFLERFNIGDDLTLDGRPIVKMRYPPGSRSMELSLYHHPDAQDPSMYVNMGDTFLGQLMVFLVIFSEPESDRFNIDVDEKGQNTNLGTTRRNIPEELRAMRAGLGPGQVRHGLRGFRQSMPVFEEFVRRMRHDMFMIEPLAYHTAIIFERYGFGYTHGKKDMLMIQQEFQPGGALYMKLTDDNPFRHSDAWKSVRGRSWAIHDGILGNPFTGFHMYKRVGHHAQINTFPDSIW